MKARRGVGALVLILAGASLAAGAPKTSAPKAAAASAARNEPVAYLVVDADTGAVLAEKDADKSWPPASMTKMMPVLLALERVRAGQASLGDPVSVSARSEATGGSQVYLARGEQFTLGQMLEAVMVASANDATVAVAEHLAGSNEAMVEQMNARARALGLTGTRFASVHGLPPERGQEPDMMTARDLATLGRELMKFPEAMRWAATDQTTFRNGTFEMRNTNHLVRTYDGITGLKTGYIAASGFSVTASAKRGDLGIVAVVLGAPTKKACFAEASRIMSETFATWRSVVAARRGVAIGTVPVSSGSATTVDALPVSDLRVLVKRAEDKGLAVEARIPRLVQAPVQREQAMGEVVVRRGDQVLGRVPVVAGSTVASAGWLAWFWNWGLPSADAAPAAATTAQR
ncbi:MAG: D-alanyl-D-alanine carboxypeptidase [bacterium]|nr:D-alanyl-D-alanine carboxypeptidase [bacterium]